MQTDSRQELAISLFPFLSILSCVIGVLVLIVTVMSIGHVATQPTDLDADGHAAAYVQLDYELREMLLEHDELATLIAEAEAAARRAEELKAELAELEASNVDTAEAERRVIAEIEHRDELQRRIDEARLRHRELAALVASKREQREMLPSDRQVKIVSSANLVEGAFGLDARSKDRPTFVECAGDSLIVHPEGTKIGRSAIAGGRQFADVLERVSADESGILIFLIREDGVKVFDAAHGATREKGVRYGFLPIPGNGEIDLSSFRG